MSLVIALMAAAVLDPQRDSLQTAAKAFDNAQLHHDRALIDRFLAPDFQYVTRNGRLLRRDAFIANTTTPGETLRPFVVADHSVLPLGPDGGVASGDAIVRCAKWQGVRRSVPILRRLRAAGRAVGRGLHPGHRPAGPVIRAYRLDLDGEGSKAEGMAGHHISFAQVIQRSIGGLMNAASGRSKGLFPLGNHGANVAFGIFQFSGRRGGRRQPCAAVFAGAMK
ncbi:MAG: nuclear transport factor 2 family protein [Caulobacteraceae bacterium]